MYGALDISTSGLVAQRIRLEVISSNLAQRDALLNDAGQYEPYRRRFAVLQSGDPHSRTPGGVRVSEIRVDDGELLKRLEPDSPYADADGYVGYPNVNPVIESMNAMEASRAYEANIAAVEATKSMISLALQMIA